VHLKSSKNSFSLKNEGERKRIKLIELLLTHGILLNFQKIPLLRITEKEEKDKEGVKYIKTSCLSIS
jgi:hypothetical protein